MKKSSHKNKTAWMWLLGAAFLITGCENSIGSGTLRNRVDKLEEEMEQKGNIINSLSAQLSEEYELRLSDVKSLRDDLDAARDSMSAFQGELAAIRKGELISFRTDLDIMQKELEVFQNKLQKMEDQLKNGSTLSKEQT